jgi:multisubunit Na+/H+ antiporter MnhB subunit
VTVEEPLRIALAVILLGLAARAVLARDALAAVVAFVVFGLMVAVAWVALGAVDVALTEAAIGGGVTGALLLGAARAAGGRKRPAARKRDPGPAAKGAAALLCASLTAALAAAWFALPDPAPTLAPQAVEAMPRLGVGNPVTAVLIGYRGWDTLLEKVVLGLALVGIWGLGADSRWGGRPGLAPVASADDPLLLLARVLPPPGIILAVYLLWTGADHPGGAFQAGTILATMGILVVLAGLADYPAVSSRKLRLAAMAGTLVFVLTGIAGFALPGGFLSFPEPYAKPVIVMVEVFLVFSIGVTLCLLVAGPPLRKEERR